MTKPHHIRRALLIALTVVAILPTLLGTPSAVSACAQLEKTTGKEGNC